MHRRAETSRIAIVSFLSSMVGIGLIDMELFFETLIGIDELDDMDCFMDDIEFSDSFMQVLTRIDQ